MMFYTAKYYFEKPEKGNWIPLSRWAGALTFGYRCTVCVGVDVEAGDAEIDVIYISFT